MIEQKTVAVYHGLPQYPATPPYSPEQAYPEYPFPRETVSGPNDAYRGVRTALELLGLDASNRATESWNPLGSIVRPGDAVILKPNFVREFRENDPNDADCLMTHGAIIRAVADYVCRALQGQGRIIIADAPQNDADFETIRRIAGLNELQAFYRSHAALEIEVYDLRPEQARKLDGVIVGHSPLPGDPAGYVRVNLGPGSAFAEINHLCYLLYGSEYDRSELHAHQHDDIHEYLVSRTVLEADVVISLPKLKTHKKVGLTVNMKNLVGINGNKNWLPHYRVGCPNEGGDQFADNGVRTRIEQTTVGGFKRLFPFLGPVRPWIARPVKALGKRLFGETDAVTIRSGNWHGNDTAWRMVVDLYRILRYADANGELHRDPVRRVFSVVDGIVAGERNGPLDPVPKPVGLVLAGSDGVAVDLACARLMGFDWRRLPVLVRAFDRHPLPLTSFEADAVSMASNDPALHGRLVELNGRLFAFEPHVGWRGQIEVDEGGRGSKGVGSCAE